MVIDDDKKSDFFVLMINKYRDYLSMGPLYVWEQ